MIIKVILVILLRTFQFLLSKGGGSAEFKPGRRRQEDGNPNSYVIAVVSDKAEGVTTSNGAVVASTTALFVLEPVAPRITFVTQIQKIDLKLDGAIGEIISN